MNNIETVAKALWTEYEQPGHTPKSEREILLALIGNIGIVSVTVQMAGGETKTITIDDLLKHHWDCIGLQYLIHDWCIAQCKVKQI